MPRPAWSMRDRIRRSSCSGLMESQSLAQTSAPKTTMPRAARRSSKARFEAKPGKRKNGVAGLGGDCRRSPFRSLRCRARFPLQLAQRHAVEKRVRISVMANGMPLARRPAGEFRVCGSIASQKKERGRHAFGLQRVQDPVRGARPGAVIEREHHFVLVERQRCGKVSAANPGAARASTSMMRSVPSARGLSGQGAAHVVAGKMLAIRQKMKRLIVCQLHSQANHLPRVQRRAYKRRASNTFAGSLACSTRNRPMASKLRSSRATRTARSARPLSRASAARLKLVMRPVCGSLSATCTNRTWVR